MVLKLVDSENEALNELKARLLHDFPGAIRSIILFGSKVTGRSSKCK